MTASGTVLVTGASGFVGRAVVARLVASGRTVRAAVRDAGAAIPEGATRCVVGDIAGPVDWDTTLAGCDTVVHCAARAHVLNETSANPLAEFRAANTAPTIDLAHAAARVGVRRLVFISSIGVNGGETHGKPFRHDDDPAPHSDYAVAKLEAEQGLAQVAGETGLEVVTIRPPLVIGRGARGNLGLLARMVARGLPLPLGMVTRNRRDLVSLETLADLVECVLDHPAAPGRTFLVSDGRSLSTRQVVEQIAALEGRKPRFLPVPPSLLGLGMRLVGKGAMASQLLGSLEVDIGHTRETLGWHPPAAQ